MKQLCAHIPPKTDSNGVGNFEAEASVSEFESVSVSAYELSEVAERDSNPRDERQETGTAGTVSVLLRGNVRETLISQEAAYACLFIDLYRKYEISTILRETVRMMNEAYFGYVTKEQETYSLFILKENHQALSEYFEKTKEVGLGLPDKAAMRIGHLLYSLEVVIKTLDDK